MMSLIFSRVALKATLVVCLDFSKTVKLFRFIERPFIMSHVLRLKCSISLCSVDSGLTTNIPWISSSANPSVTHRLTENVFEFWTTRKPLPPTYSLRVVGWLATNLIFLFSFEAHLSKSLKRFDRSSNTICIIKTKLLAIMSEGVYAANSSVLSCYLQKTSPSISTNNDR